MVRLNAAQEKFLTRLKAGKDAYDTAVAEIEFEARMQKEHAKKELTALIQEALDANVPARQVAVKGLGYADVGSLKQYLEPRVTIPATWNAVSKATEPEKQTAGNEEVTIRLNDWLDDPGEWYVTDTFGNQFELTTGFGANNWYSIGLEKFKEEHTDWKELQDAITEHFEGKVIWNER